MVLTQAEIKRQKEIKINPKPYDANRKFMRKDQVLQAKKIEAEKQKKVDEFKKQLDAETAENEPKVVISPAAQDEKAKRIEKLKALIENEKGPGSKVRKEKLQEELEALSKN